MKLNIEDRKKAQLIIDECAFDEDKMAMHVYNLVALLNLAEQAWGVIANVNDGNLDIQRPDWLNAAKRFRENYHSMMKPYLKYSDRIDGEVMP